MAELPSADALSRRARREGRPAAAAVVWVRRQRLSLYRGGRRCGCWPVSTASAGLGGAADSGRTPTGWHEVVARFGAGAAPGVLFVGRRAQPLLTVIEHRPRRTGGDHICSRILWLGGLEPGRNQGPGCDSRARYIYIHGTAEEGLLGHPVSRGCVRMANADVIALFEALPLGALVYIDGAAPVGD